MTPEARQTIIRNMVADFLNVADPGQSEEFVLMGTGFTTLDENPNAQVETRPYISDASASAVIRGYEVQFPYNMDLIASERAVMKIYAAGRNQKQAGAAEMDYIRSEVFLTTGIDRTHPARRFRVAVEVSDTTGEGTQIVEGSGNLNGVGDPIMGVMNIQTRQFTAGEWNPETEILTVEVSGETIQLRDGLVLITP